MNRVLPKTGLLAVIAGVMLTGCVVAGPPVVAAPPPIPVPRVEIVPPSPGPLFVWLPGYWGWSRSSYVWYDGRWATPPGRGYAWRPGYWDSRRGGQVWVDAGWHRR